MAKKNEPVVIQAVDPSIEKRQKDQAEIRRLNAEMHAYTSAQPMVTFKPPKYYADIVGKVYPFTYNGMTFAVIFNGEPQKFPENVYNHLIRKLGKILDESAPITDFDNLI